MHDLETISPGPHQERANPADAAETRRLAALARYNIVDSGPDQLFDDIALLAAEICDVPMALISLVEQDRQWFKSVVGMVERETSRSVSFCAHTLHGSDVLQVTDALEDERFATNLLVTDGPGIRFYAGAPLRTPDGYTLGTLCVLDRVPRTLSPNKLRALEILARQVMARIELRLKVMEEERTAAALRQAEKLAAVGRLASAISHEINNPLQAITNLLYMADTAPTHEGSREFLKQAQDELGHVKHVVTQTLRFHKQSERPSPVPLPGIVDSVLSLFRTRLGHRDVKVQRRDRSQSDLLCYGADLRQVIANLISNATDAARGGGTVYIRTRETAKFILLTVADNGYGMSAETRARLFEPFYTTKAGVGTGLGLWVSKGILDKHNARVSVRSSQHRGACGSVFRIAFPRDTALEA